MKSSSDNELYDEIVKNKNSFNNRMQELYKRKRKLETASKESQKVQKVEKPEVLNVEENSLRLGDLGLMEDFVQALLELVGPPMLRPELFLSLGVKPIRGLLLHGPPGCGKTVLASALAGELNVPLLSISAPSVVSGMSGESERTIREIFVRAQSCAPCIVLLDEIDAIAPSRESAQREMEKRIVSQLLTCLDSLDPLKNNGKPVVVIGTTNRPDSIDSALRRPGRFDRELLMGIPDKTCRLKILQVLTRSMTLSSDCELDEIAQRTPGYVGADLNLLTSEAGMSAVKRAFQSSSGELNEAILPSFSNDSKITVVRFLKSSSAQTEDVSVELQDFLHALQIVQPSSKRQGFVTVPGVKWSDIGALELVRKELCAKIVNHVKFPEVYAFMGIDAPEGILLWGPPGCGKTLLARAMAGESHSNFISVKGPELLNKYVGESERAVRQVFARARASAPCVIFFDEIDALAPKRDDARSEASSRVVNTLLTELDGLESRARVHVVAATNRPDIIDPAVLRPGRLGVRVFVGLPSPHERVSILATVAKKTPLAPDCNFALIAHDPRCNGFSGADLAALVREATMLALDEQRESLFALSGPVGHVALKHFDSALNSVAPSVESKNNVR